MKAMRKRFLAASLGLAAVSLIASDASATRFTEEATFNLVSNDPVNGVTPVVNSEIVSGFDGSGGFFSNTFTTPDVNGSVQINAVGAIEVGSIKLANGSTLSSIRSPLDPAARVVVIFALTGNSSLVNGVPVENVSAGRAIVLESVPAGSFDRFDPETWDWTSINGANVLATYNLAPKEDLVAGNGDTRAESANVMNQISINIATPVQVQGRLLFDLEYQNPLLPDDAIAGIGGTLAGTGIFQQNETPLVGLPGTEGIYVEPDGTVVSDLVGAQIPTKFTAADLTIVNDIFDELIDGTEDDSPLFATGLNGAAASDYSPVNAGQITFLTPDFVSDLGVEVVPTSQAAIPEPATLTLGLFGLAAFAARRRKHMA